MVGRPQAPRPVVDIVAVVVGDIVAAAVVAQAEAADPTEPRRCGWFQATGQFLQSQEEGLGLVDLPLSHAVGQEVGTPA